MRLFVALDIPEATREALAKLIHRFARVCPGARWVRIESLHITLKFVGEVKDAEVPTIKMTLSEINSPESIEIVFRQFGFFPSEHHPRVFWVGMETGHALADLAAQIETQLQALGIPREKREFRPHLTLARFISIEGLQRLREMIPGLATTEFGRMTASEFYLYQSILKRSGAEYTRLATFTFARGSE